MKDTQYEPKPNPDLKTSGASAHPVGTTVGAATGAVTGAAMGTAVAGPVGGAVGGMVGAAAGALAGHSIAEAGDPTVEDAYWRENYSKADYFEHDRPYSDYRPAYKYGWESRANLGTRSFEDAERDLARGWASAKGQSKLAWEQAKNATRDAWNRIERALPGDADGDGR